MLKILLVLIVTVTTEQISHRRNRRQDDIKILLSVLTDIVANKERDFQPALAEMVHELDITQAPNTDNSVVDTRISCGDAFRALQAGGVCGMCGRCCHGKGVSREKVGGYMWHAAGYRCKAYTWDVLYAGKPKKPFIWDWCNWIAPEEEGDDAPKDKTDNTTAGRGTWGCKDSGNSFQNNMGQPAAPTAPTSRPTPSSQCIDASNQVCPNLQSQGQTCETCLFSHQMDRIMLGSCPPIPWEDTLHYYCYVGNSVENNTESSTPSPPSLPPTLGSSPSPSPSSSPSSSPPSPPLSQCIDASNEVCPNLEGKGQTCESCMVENESDIIQRLLAIGKLEQNVLMLPASRRRLQQGKNETLNSNIIVRNNCWVNSPANRRRLQQGTLQQGTHPTTKSNPQTSWQDLLHYFCYVGNSSFVAPPTPGATPSSPAPTSGVTSSLGPVAKQLFLALTFAILTLLP